MKILILGGTGAIGKYLVDICKKNHHFTTVSTRQQLESSQYVNYIQGNAHDIDFLNVLCSQHWDALIDFMSYKTDEFEQRVNLLLNSTDQYVYISSSRVYANEEHPIKESSPRLLDICKDKKYLCTDEYALTKARQENILFRHKKNNYIIIRPYITYGDNRLQLGVLEKEEWLYRAIHGRTIVFSKNISQKITTITSGYDVASGIYKLLGKENINGHAFNITSKIKLTWSEVFEVYKSVVHDCIGVDLKIKYVNDKRFINSRPKYLWPQVIYDRLYNRDFDTSKETEFIDVDNFMSPFVGLKKCCCTFLKEPKFGYINWKFEALKDKYVGETTPLNEIPGIKNKLKYFINRYLL